MIPKELIMTFFYLSVICFPAMEASAAEAAFSPSEKQTLLHLARTTITHYLQTGSLPEVDESQLSNKLKKKAACFVTLNKKGSGLRGCIGMFERSLPLYKSVMSRAVAAAVQDPRFSRVTPDELADIKLDISVLTDPRDLEFSSAEDLLRKLRPRVDGVILQTPYGGSTFLPQVWEQLPDKEQFLYHLCRKHGAPGMIWKEQPDKIKVQVYQAIVIEEEHYGGDTSSR